MLSTRLLSDGAGSFLLIICCAGAACWASQAPKSPLSVAVAQFQAGHYQEAVATLTAAIRANPKGGENLYLLLSECYAQQADPAKATATLRDGLRAYPAA
jgi:tetratricopeptide (TPR) repeat protein